MAKLITLPWTRDEIALDLLSKYGMVDNAMIDKYEEYYRKGYAAAESAFQKGYDDGKNMIEAKEEWDQLCKREGVKNVTR